MNIFRKEIHSVKKLFIKHQPFILFSIIAIAMPFLFSQIPYINLVYTVNKGIIIYLLLILIFIQPSIKFLLSLGIILSFSALVLLLLGFPILAETVGNMIFFLLMIGVLSRVYVYFNDNKQ